MIALGRWRIGSVGVGFFAFISLINVAIVIIPGICLSHGPTWKFIVPGIHWVPIRSLGRGPMRSATSISRGASGAPICGALVVIVIMFLFVVIMFTRRSGMIGMVIGRSRSLGPTSLVVVTLGGVWFPERHGASIIVLVDSTYVKFDIKYARTTILGCAPWFSPVFTFFAPL